MKKAYVSGPLRALTPYLMEQNILSARSEAEALWKIGFATFCPHLNTLGMVGMLGNDEEDFIKGDLLFIDNCDCLVMIPGWRDSEGAMLEYDHAVSLSIDVFEAERYHSWNGTDAWVLNNQKRLARDDMMSYARGY
jgi:hypothetical protein